MSERSIEVYFKADESSEKFDYFVCSVAGALFAYIGRDYVPRKLGLGIPLIEPLSLVFLVASFYCGIKRIECKIHARRLNHKRLTLRKGRAPRLPRSLKRKVQAHFTMHKEGIL